MRRPPPHAGVLPGVPGARRAGPARPRRLRPRAAAAAGPGTALVLGSGGREHALAWALRAPGRTVLCAPGNAGVEQEPGVECVASLDVADHAAVAAFCVARGVDLVVVGPEAPLVAGIADDLAAAGLRVFGPSKAAARLEGSKAFMKDLCRKYGIPTAASATFTDAAAARAHVRQMGAPIVVKADGLAAGKGVVVAATEAEALAAVEEMMVAKAFGAAGGAVVVEEFMEGEEASYFVVADGEDFVALASAQDHKAVGEGDTGPNTGGMGAYSPAPAVTGELERAIQDDIIRPLLRGMALEGAPYRGVIFAGIMIDAASGRPRLLEVNVRFGDPECQCLVTRLESDLGALLAAACSGTLREVELAWRDEVALLVVLATKGYPGPYGTGSLISPADPPAGKATKVFHAGTVLDEAGGVRATGGRVLGVTATAPTVAEAQRLAYRAVDAVGWEDGFCRRDIGWRAVAREEAARQGGKA